MLAPVAGAAHPSGPWISGPQTPLFNPLSGSP